jgi:hypothetical protein
VTQLTNSGGEALARYGRLLDNCWLGMFIPRPECAQSVSIGDIQFGVMLCISGRLFLLILDQRFSFRSSRSWVQFRVYL